mmetsp:Transcript_3268/g.6090  ORF Transcript_3268/g.6090 Transcript_3268/m.6090 type:complete len:138 (-) Transcript_3268:130-543(-)
MGKIIVPIVAEVTIYGANLIRPATAPDTIVAAAAEKAQLKYNPTQSELAREKNDRADPPAKEFPPSDERLYPIAHHPIVTIETSKRFFSKIVCVLIDLMDPASTSPKPSCITKTSIPHSSVQLASTASFTVDSSFCT